MTEKRMTLAELGKELEAMGYKFHAIALPPIDSETVKLLEDYGSKVSAAFRAGEKRRKKEPSWNSSGQCPSCRSKKYFPLYGGLCEKKCANCGHAYDAVSLEEYFKHHLKH